MCRLWYNKLPRGSQVQTPGTLIDTVTTEYLTLVGQEGSVGSDHGTQEMPRLDRAASKTRGASTSPATQYHTANCAPDNYHTHPRLSPLATSNSHLSPEITSGSSTLRTVDANHISDAMHKVLFWGSFGMCLHLNNRKDPQRT